MHVMWCFLFHQLLGKKNRVEKWIYDVTPLAKTQTPAQVSFKEKVIKVPRSELDDKKCFNLHSLSQLYFTSFYSSKDFTTPPHFTLPLPFPWFDFHLTFTPHIFSHNHLVLEPIPPFYYGHTTNGGSKWNNSCKASPDRLWQQLLEGHGFYFLFFIFWP